MSYEAYTTEFDRVIHIRDLAQERQIGHGEFYAFENSLQRYGFAVEMPAELPGGVPITVLLDCSGSMRGAQTLAAVNALRALGDGLSAAGRPFEFLGYTTKSWRGGAAARAWADAGRVQNPGRLCELEHIVLKDMGETWEESRAGISGLLIEGLLKENVDGEAVEWAVSRMHAAGQRGPLIVFSDGAPIDDSTLARNPPTYLRDHLHEVLAQNRDVNLQAITLLQRQSRPAMECDAVWPDPIEILMPVRPADATEVSALGLRIYEGLLNAVSRIDLKAAPALQAVDTDKALGLTTYEPEF